MGIAIRSSPGFGLHPRRLTPSVGDAHIPQFDVPNDAAIAHGKHGDANADEPHEINEFGPTPSRLHDQGVIVHFLEVGIVGAAKVIVVFLTSVVAMSDNEDAEPEEQ